MNLFSRKTLLESLASVCFDLTAAWIAVIFISPGLFNGGSSPQSFILTLLANIPWAVVVFVLGLTLQERSKKYEYK